MHADFLFAKRLGEGGIDLFGLLWPLTQPQNTLPTTHMLHKSPLEIYVVTVNSPFEMSKLGPILYNLA